MLYKMMQNNSAAFAWCANLTLRRFRPGVGFAAAGTFSRRFDPVCRSSRAIAPRTLGLGRHAMHAVVLHGWVVGEQCGAA